MNLYRVLARIQGEVLRARVSIFHRGTVKGPILSEGETNFRQFGTRILAGGYCRVGRRVTFVTEGQGRIVLGNCVNLTQDIVLSSASTITIGDHCQIAEFVSIRDRLHGTLRDDLVCNQVVAPEPVTIGVDVWIGRSVYIGPGVNIGDGAIIGANSVVISDLPSNSVCVGSPARVIRMRE